MADRQRNLPLYLYLAAALLTLIGCAPPFQKPVRICPGVSSVEEALSVLEKHSQAVSFRADGKCHLKYRAEGREHNENFPVKLWVSPPAKIYLQGDVAFDPKGLVLGSNENEFWLSLKPKEISSYWWGRWDEQNCLQKLMMLLNAFGISRVYEEKDWLLSKQGPFDILTEQNDPGKTVRRVYISSCDRLVGKIEYLNSDGRTVVVAELDKYKRVCEDYSVAAVIKITILAADGREDSAKLSLDTIKPMNFTEKQRSRLFTRPKPAGFEHIYKFGKNCDVLEQPQ